MSGIISSNFNNYLSCNTSKFSDKGYTYTVKRRKQFVFPITGTDPGFMLNANLTPANMSTNNDDFIST